MRERRLPRLGLLGLMTDGYEPIFPGITARQEAYAREIVQSMTLQTSRRSISPVQP